MKSIIIASLLSLGITLGGYIGVVKFTAKRKAVQQEVPEELSRAELAAADLAMKGFAEQRDAMVSLGAAYRLVQSNIQTARGILVEEERKLEAMRAAVDSVRAVASSENDEALGKVAKLYESMKPSEAAQIAEQLSTDLLVQIIPRMKERSAGKLLSAMDAARAAEISRRMAGQKRGSRRARAAGK